MVDLILEATTSSARVNPGARLSNLPMNSNMTTLLEISAAVNHLQSVQHPSGSHNSSAGSLLDAPHGNSLLEGADLFQQNAGLRRTCDLLLDELKEFRTALNHHAMVDTTDADGKITYVNDRFCEISKYSREELLGRDHRIINSGYHGRRFFAAMWDTISRGEVWKGEIRNRAKDGSFYWEAVTIVPLLNPKIGRASCRERV